VDHGGEALIGFVAAHGHSLELLQLAKEVLDQMALLVDVLVNFARPLAPGHLRDADLGAALVQLLDDPVGVKRLVGDQALERDALDQGRHADRVMALARQQDKAHQVAQGVRQRQDLGRQAAAGLADGLASGRPFAPWPWRWTRTIVASTIAYSMSGSSDTAANMRWNTPARTQSRKHLNTVFHLPNEAGRSCHGLPVRATHSTASTRGIAFGMLLT
jgi:hypothetical protein